MKKLIILLSFMRPQQWTKNLFVFAALIFSNSIFKKTACINVLLTFCAFCLTSSLGYILNDWKDKEKDRIHPDKRNRPLASGAISSKEALLFAVFIAIMTIMLVVFIDNNLWIVLTFYLLLSVGYTFIFKHIAILDILIVSLGFILRAVSGAVVIKVEISSWLLVCTFFLALFLIVSKRRFELVSLGVNAENHRKTLSEYSVQLLDQMIAVITGLTIISYSLYTLSPKTIQKFHTENLIFTIPFVVFGMFRYLYLIYIKDSGEKPEKILLSDKHIQLSIILWIISVAIIIYK